MDPDRRFDRATALERLADEEFDVLVIGGGVTGAGVALDAASRGLRTALVERDDFASGTSSKSSKLVHGGLRYLQQREFRLVYENLAERQRLLENAPHLVARLPFLIPLFGRNGVVAKAVTRSYSTVLWLYDVTGGLRIGSRHRKVTRDEALGHLPQLKTDRLVAGFLYFDARADDARLTLTLLRTAALDHGAAVANYAGVEMLLTDGAGAVTGARVRPTAGNAAGNAAGNGAGAGSGAASGAPVDVRARVVVNATGVWADDLRIPGGGDERPALRPAKGVHVTVPAHRLPCDIAAVIPVPHDRRSIFVVPWPEGDRTYIGTTDTAYAGPLEDPRCTPEDVAYLLEAVNAATTAALTPDDIVGVWAGLRPLLAPADDRQVSERTADLSRRHTVTTSGTGVVTVTGGKLTTYRKMAADTVDEVVRHLGGGPRPCVTKRLRLRGAAGAPDGPGGPAQGPDVPGGPAQGPDVPGGPAGAPAPAVVAHLRARYGAEWVDVAALAEDRPELLDPIVAGLPYVGAEVVHAARAEMARTVDDVLGRRTRALLLDGRRSAAAALAVAQLLGTELGWEQERVLGEASAFTESALGELEAAGLARTATQVPQG